MPQGTGDEQGDSTKQLVCEILLWDEKKEKEEAEKEEEEKESKNTHTTWLKTKTLLQN